LIGFDIYKEVQCCALFWAPVTHILMRHNT
jgi:hypothetical protein